MHNTTFDPDVHNTDHVDDTHAVCVCACVQKDIAIIKSSYSYQQDVIVCCSSSLTERQITACLSTVS